MNIERVLSELNQCTGCSACMAGCNSKAVFIKEDEQQRYGYTAWIDKDLCTDCGACRQICPVLNPPENPHAKEPACYAVCAEDDILEKSASGGAFSLLADHILKMGGVVAGAAYGEDFRVEQVLIRSEEELGRLRRSKYVQSRMGHLLEQVKDELAQGTPVLFVGTPCQIAGARAYLGEQSGLFLVDLYCGHTPAFRLFERYLHEAFEPGQVRQYDFRTKQRGWVADIATVTMQDDTQTICDSGNDDYQKCYHSRLAMREVCENCRFSGFPRQGDLTIADFWWIEETYPELKNEKGTSAVLVNSDKGELLLKAIEESADVCVQTELKAMEKNRPEKVEANRARDRFYRLLEERSFHEAVEMSLSDHYDVVLWGNWSEKNYGSELTYYALYSVLAATGREVLMVERPETAVWGPNDSPVLFRVCPYPSGSLLVPSDKTEMIKLNQCSDTFMVGSDQIWHHDLYDCFGKVCYLDFIHNTHKKIAYSSSFGREYWDGTEAEAAKAGKMLRDFDYVSVREPSGVGLCRDLFGTKAQTVLDPVFLCPDQVWKDLCDKSILPDKKHIAVYLLDITDTIEQGIAETERILELEAFIITDAFTEAAKRNWNRAIYAEASLEDWVYNIRSAEYVVTDSFHGMCLAILFEKPFIAISNEKRGAVRFRELLSRLKLENRLLEDPSELAAFRDLAETPVNYEAVSEILSEEKKYSMDWLLHSLETKKEQRYGADDYLTERIDEAETAVHDLQREHQRILDWHTDRLAYHDQISDWHTSRLDYNEKIRDWHSGRLDYNEKIRDWHTERLDYQQKTIERLNQQVNQQLKQELKQELEQELTELREMLFKVQETVDHLPSVVMKKKLHSLDKQHGQDSKKRGR